MKKYHYLDDRGDISDALPLAALQKIGLPPTTKVLIEGGQQWITLAEAMAGGSVVVPLPPPPVAASENPAKPPPPLSGLKKVFKGCLILVIGFPIFIGILMYLADRGVGGAKVSNAGAEATRDNASKTRDGGGEKARDGRWKGGSGGGAEQHIAIIIGNRIGTFLIQGREVAPQEGTIMERSGNGTTFDCEVKSSSGIIWKFEMIWNKDSQMWTLQGLNYSVQLRKMTDDEWKQFNATKYKSIE